ncbi:MAG: PpiC-type peptidyl-prolyl cis-trans isomerase [Clostridia bacterium]|jgi:peptidyl-prolyl cis-trans isomerase C|nr:PpiC-type peptidyl-prolyl cis-trans isomerase [Clostridia bacterium]
MENKVLAIVDGRDVTQNDLYELLQNIGQNAGNFQDEEGQKQLINELVMQELLYSDALAHGLNQDAEYINALEHMQKTLLKQYALNKLLTSVQVTDEEVSEYFESHKTLFQKPEMARASHILVATKEEAESILNEINNGLEFKEAAKKYSSCPSKAEGGNLGEFTRGRMVPEFDKAVFAMTPGEIAGPIQTQFGFHLIRLESLSKEASADLDEVITKVKEQCLLAKRQDLYLKKQEALQNVYTVEIK